MVAARQAQMVRDCGPVQLVAVEGLVQRAFQGDLRVVRLVGVHVQVACGPGAGLNRLGIDRRGLRHHRRGGRDDFIIVVVAAAAGAQQGDANQRQRHDGPPQAGYFELHGLTPTQMDGGSRARPGLRLGGLGLGHGLPDDGLRRPAHDVRDFRQLQVPDVLQHQEHLGPVDQRQRLRDAVLLRRRQVGRQRRDGALQDVDPMATHQARCVARLAGAGFGVLLQ
ncbi:hypothetical protein G6F22_017591 [Rhizopus arrhizus]|nr:hypothetical protein G6F22_017591 [Rhizopus arrhizus]